MLGASSGARLGYPLGGLPKEPTGLLKLEPVTASILVSAEGEMPATSNTNATLNPPTTVPSTKHASLPFHGMPPEIVQLIASFMPFHDLIKVYTSFPRIHKPILRRQLEHALALMMLTLEIRQETPQDDIDSSSTLAENRSFTESPFIGSPTLTTETVVEAESSGIKTQWRVTAFDPVRMRVEFQLEEKLGLQMAEKRRLEILSQHRALSPPQRADVSNVTLEDLSKKPSASPMSYQSDIESLIWNSRRRSTAIGVHPNGSTILPFGEEGAGVGTEIVPNPTANTIATTPTPTPSLEFGFGLVMDDLGICDTNFFHCDATKPDPVLSSATVSFKAHRNIAASWVEPSPLQQRSFASLLSSSSKKHRASVGSNSALTATTIAETTTPGHQDSYARDRIAAFQQNRVLMRSLARMKSRFTSSQVQFLPMSVELNTRELTQKQVEAHMVGFLRKQKSSVMKSSSQPSCSSSSSAESDSDESEGFPISFKTLLRRSPWGISKRSKSLRAMEDLICSCRYGRASHYHTSEAGSMASSSWSSTLLETLSSSLARRPSHHNARAKSHWCPRCGRDAVVTLPTSSRPLILRTTTVSDRTTPFLRAPSTKGGACSSTDERIREEEEEEEDNSLFEFTYDVRHNYLHSSRLEGERVIRPIRFSCLLSFFEQGVEIDS
ncbi:hypothetical protein BGW38_002322 [Lunasporangiospora selenospora]|uniref:F-box domain-containing protein n=1 Tax=Lunasporangiospora selenospora TaxID=979761 RepID=A0A9P6FSI7_9FUNG|nr:hypothetical protein BGW38_002322 [Lunasporangiospora selenospora]